MTHSPDALQRRREERRRELRARRVRALAIGAGVVALAVLAWSAIGGGGEDEMGGSDRDTSASPTLPGGGRRVFPDHRVVAFYGAPQAEELGVLGIGPPGEVGAKLRRQARPYATARRPVLPAFELIAVVAADAPGEGDLYRTRQSDAVIGRYLRAARRANAILVLDIQPGRSDFLTEAKALQRWLEEPDVALALDPEWRMGPDEIPGQTIGSVDAGEVNAVSSWLAEIVSRRRLPEKLLVVHQFTDGMIARRAALEDPPGVALTLNADGFGTKDQKLAKYRELVPRRGNAGFKLFYREDTGLMSPREVLGLRPEPDLVVYE